MHRILLVAILMITCGQAFARNTTLGSMALTPQGKLGVIGSKIAQHNGTVVIGFHDRLLRTSHSENHSVNQLQLTVNSLPWKSLVLKPGDFVQLDTSPQVIYEVFAIFENQKVLVAPLAERLNPRFQLSSDQLVPLPSIKEIIAPSTFLNSFIDAVQTNVEHDLQRLSINLKKTLDCLENNTCNFAVKHRRINPAGGKDASIYALEDFTITDSDQLFKLLRRQAINYKIYAALANADVLTTVSKLYPKALVKSIYPAKGLAAIPFKQSDVTDMLAQAYAALDVQSARTMMSPLMAMGGVKETHPENIFEKSEACNTSGCYNASYYSDFVQPLYQMMVREMAQSQPYLSFLNWNLNRADFIQAVGKAQKEADQARAQLAALEGNERYLFLSFGTSVEQELDKVSALKSQLLLELFQQEDKKKSLIGDVLVEIQKPQFWGILACYGVSTFSPIKFMHLACHAAGISVASYSLYLSAQKTRTLFGLNKLAVINPEQYTNALTMLTIESALTLMYFRVALPDFSEPLKAVSKNITAKLATNVGASNMNKLVHNDKALSATKDQLLDIVQKMGVSKLLGGVAAASSLLGAMIDNNTFEDMTLQRDGDLYQMNLLTASEVYMRIGSHKVMVQIFGMSKAMHTATLEAIDANRKVLNETVNLIDGLSAE